MKVIFNKETLLCAIGPAAAVAPVRNTLATVEGILFECPGERDNSCRITSYDMEKGFRTSVDAEIIEEGSYIINSQNILQIVKSMPAGDIIFETDEKNRVKISAGASSFEINAIPGENYPSLPLLAGDRNYDLPQYIFRSLVSKTAFSAAVNDQKPVFNGVYFNIENGCLKCVGCDGQRLGLAKTEIAADAPAAAFIVPAKILFELMRNVHDSEDNIRISLARKHVIFKIGEFTYFSRLIEGQYLNYERILPESFERTAYINTAAFKGAVERASIVTEDKLGTSTAKTYIKLDFDTDVLKISSASTGGSVYEELPAAITGEPLIIAFNCRFLIDALKAAEGAETLCLKMNGPLMGICIEEAASSKEESEKNPVDYTFFILPLRMKGK